MQWIRKKSRSADTIITQPTYFPKKYGKMLAQEFKNCLWHLPRCKSYSTWEEKESRKFPSLQNERLKEFNFNLNEENSNRAPTQTRYPNIAAGTVIHRIDHVTSRCFTSWANFYKCLWLSRRNNKAEKS